MHGAIYFVYLVRTIDHVEYRKKGKAKQRFLRAREHKSLSENPIWASSCNAIHVPLARFRADSAGFQIGSVLGSPILFLTAENAEKTQSSRRFFSVFSGPPPRALRLFLGGDFKESVLKINHFRFLGFPREIERVFCLRDTDQVSENIAFNPRPHGVCHT